MLQQRPCGQPAGTWQHQQKTITEVSDDNQRTGVRHSCALNRKRLTTTATIITKNKINKTK